MKNNIALIGFMGAGKTVVGKTLAQRLNREFIETDTLIEQKAGKPIPEIFRQDGETAFRELEIEVIKEVAGEKNKVIACGGGVVHNKINTDRLKPGAVIVYLTATPQVILKRTSGEGGTRPLLNVTDRATEIRELLRLRKPLYERAADFKIDTSKLDIDSAAAQIISKLTANESFS